MASGKKNETTGVEWKHAMEAMHTAMMGAIENLEQRELDALAAVAMGAHAYNVTGRVRTEQEIVEQFTALPAESRRAWKGVVKTVLANTFLVLGARS